MSLPEKVRFEITGEIGREAAEDYASKIRAAMRNGITTIELAFHQDCVIRSAEFLAFLHAVHAHAKTSGGELVISGASRKTRDLLQIARVGGVKASAEQVKGDSA